MPTKLGQQMNDLIRGQQAEPTAGQQRADEIRDLYKQGLQQLRGTRNMHPDARRVEAAKLYSTTRAALAKVKAEQAETDSKTFAKLEAKLWGLADLRGIATDRASFDTAARDANDRAASLKNESAAARALDQAERAGDQVLARAIAKRCHDMDWDSPVQAYLATRPTAAEDYQQAGAIWQRYNTPDAVVAQQGMAVLGKPEELRGMSEQDITSMAEPGDVGSSAA
ncbi:hypothetical protein [Streptomyces sp. 1222.5]|uniref:hypothetical protein n=1 Tax=Streptomyces sp. 1222.5 TaxID=1881026 RepID=UPI003D71D7FF